ncbi:MAG TPA: hypothetical protein DCQ28_04590, partial [Bacteroidetes bacterium]|nr:hypothetical protein [Bacteroidota bacterium]
MKTLKTNILILAAMVIFVAALSVSAQEQPKSAKEKLMELMQEPISEPNSEIKVEIQSTTPAPVTATVDVQRKIKKTRKIQQAVIDPVSTTVTTENKTEAQHSITVTSSNIIESSVVSPKNDSIEILFYIILLATITTLFVIRRNIMKWFLDLKIGTKLITSFSLIAFIAAVIGYQGYSGATAIKENQDTLYLDRLIPIRDLGYANAALLTIRGNVTACLATKSMEERQKYILQIRDEEKKIGVLIDAYAKTVLVKEEEETLPIFEKNWKQYTEGRNKALDLILEGNDQQATTLIFGANRQYMLDSRASLLKLIEINAKVAEELDMATDVKANASINLMMVMLVGGVILSLGLGIFISRMIANPVNELVMNIDNADLHSQFNSVRKDEIGDL